MPEDALWQGRIGKRGQQMAIGEGERDYPPSPVYGSATGLEWLLKSLSAIVHLHVWTLNFSVKKFYRVNVKLSTGN